MGARQRAFTLIEMLTVVLLIAILMTIAMPLYLASERNAGRRVCRANQQTIASAVVGNCTVLHATDYSIFIGAVNPALLKEPDLGTTPICPDGGAYSIAQGNSGSNATFKIVCSIAVHGTFQPGVDAN